MVEGKSNNLSSYLKQLEDFLDLYFSQKAPALPVGAKETLVKFLPWILIVLLVFTLPTLLAGFGISTFLLPASFIPVVSGLGALFTLSLVVMSASILLELIAIPGLFKKSAGSWKLLYYATLIGALANLITLNVVSLVIWTTISLYLLFQIKSYYK